MKIYLKKKLNGLFEPAYPSDLETSKKLAVGDIYEFETKKPRNLAYHRKFFALINMVMHNSAYTDQDALRSDLLIAAGYFDEYVDLWGETKLKAKSVSFSSMGQDEFEKVVNAVIDVLVSMDWEKSEIIENLESFY